MNGEITIHTNNKEKLVLQGLWLDRVEETFSLEQFISDPHVKAPLLDLLSDQQKEKSEHEQAVQRSKRASKAWLSVILQNLFKSGKEQEQEDWFQWWRFFAGDQYVVLKRPLPEVYTLTGEKTILAILRTCSPDLLPISEQVPEMYKRTHYSHHFD